MITTVLTKGVTLGKDALSKAKEFNQKHQFTSTTTTKVTSLEKKIELFGKIATGASMVNGKVKEMDRRFQVLQKTKSAFTVAEQKVSSAGSAVVENKYVFTITGASWVTGSFSKVAKAAGYVGRRLKRMP